MRQAAAWLWQGDVEPAPALFQACNLDQARQFCNDLKRHQQRLVNDAYGQAEGLPMGAGAVESSIKSIEARMKLTDAQWHSENVPKAWSIRCAYLNGQWDV